MIFEVFKITSRETPPKNIKTSRIINRSAAGTQIDNKLISSKLFFSSLWANKICQTIRNKRVKFPREFVHHSLILSSQNLCKLEWTRIRFRLISVFCEVLKTFHWRFHKKRVDFHCSTYLFYSNLITDVEKLDSPTTADTNVCLT